MPERQILLRHSFRNALLPMKITIAGLHVPTLLSGALMTATVVTWPGMGRLFLDSIGYRDDPVVMGILMFSAVLVLVGSLLADLLYGVADPVFQGAAYDRYLHGGRVRTIPAATRWLLAAARSPPLPSA